MGGDGASLDGELRRLGEKAWELLHDPEFVDTLTESELKRIVEVLDGAYQRKLRRED